mgnify:CR=1 FL=1
MQSISQRKNKLRYAYLLTPAGVAEKSKRTAQSLRRQVGKYETVQAEFEALKSEFEFEDDLQKDAKAYERASYRWDWLFR